MPHIGAGYFSSAQRALANSAHGAFRVAWFQSLHRLLNQMPPLKTPSELAADDAVRLYLHGRTMPPILYDAIVWAVELRISAGRLPVLDETLTTDIDNHAVATRARLLMPVRPAPAPPPCPPAHRDAGREPLPAEGM
jgi:hypothetical protein